MSKSENWKDTGYLEFLETHKNPPKGFKPRLEDTSISIRKQNVNVPHVVLSPKESYIFSIIEESTGIKDILKDEYIPLHVEFNDMGKIYSTSATKALKFLKSKLKQKLKNSLEKLKQSQKKGSIFYRQALPEFNRIKNSITEQVEIINTVISRIKNIGIKREFLYSELPGQTSVKGFDLSKDEFIIFGEICELINMRSPGYEFTEYLYDRNGRKIKLGKVLKKIEKNIEQISKKINIPINEISKTISKLKKQNELGIKNIEWKLVVSGDPSDILGMSTDRGWTNCMDLKKCQNIKEDFDAKMSTRDMIAYAIDKEHDNWLSRVWLRYDGEGGWWPEATVYSVKIIDDQSFFNFVVKWLKDQGIYGKPGQFDKGVSGWSDYLEGIIPEFENVDIDELKMYENGPKNIGKFIINTKNVLSPKSKNNLKNIIRQLFNNSKFLDSPNNKSIVVEIPENFIPSIKHIDGVFNVYRYSAPQMYRIKIKVKPFREDKILNKALENKNKSEIEKKYINSKLNSLRVGIINKIKKNNIPFKIEKSELENLIILTNFDGLKIIENSPFVKSFEKAIVRQASYDSHYWVNLRTNRVIKVRGHYEYYREHPELFLLPEEFEYFMEMLENFSPEIQDKKMKEFYEKSVLTRWARISIFGNEVGVESPNSKTGLYKIQETLMNLDKNSGNVSADVEGNHYGADIKTFLTANKWSDLNREFFDDDKPLTKKIEPGKNWKDTHPFEFMPEQYEKPKGFIPKQHEYETQLDRANGIPITTSEYKTLSNLLEQINYFNPIKNDDNFYYIPFKINGKHYKIFIKELRQFIRNRISLMKVEMKRPELYYQKHFRNSIKLFINSDNVLKAISKRQINKKYRYDITQQFSYPKISISNVNAYVIEKIARYFNLSIDSDTNLGDPNTKFGLYLTDANNRKIKIGKFISKIWRNIDDVLQYLFDNKFYLTKVKLMEIIEEVEKQNRELPKLNAWKLIVSADPSDLKTMSTGRGWGSCMSEGEEKYEQCIDSVLSSNDMIAYAVDDKHDNWLKRMWLRYDGEGGWWPETKKDYGVGVVREDFIKAVTKWLNDKGVYGKVGQYDKNARGWSDEKWENIDTEQERRKENELVRKEQERSINLPYEEWNESINSTEKSYKVEYESSYYENYIKKMIKLKTDEKAKFPKTSPYRYGNFYVLFPENYFENVKNIEGIKNIKPVIISRFVECRIFFKDEIFENYEKFREFLYDFCREYNIYPFLSKGNIKAIIPLECLPAIKKLPYISEVEKI